MKKKSQDQHGDLTMIEEGYLKDQKEELREIIRLLFQVKEIFKFLKYFFSNIEVKNNISYCLVNSYNFIF